jgi:hypothetical protein
MNRKQVVKTELRESSNFRTPLYINLHVDSICGSMMQEQDFYTTSNTFSFIICQRNFLSSQDLEGHKKALKGELRPAKRFSLMSS